MRRVDDPQFPSECICTYKVYMDNESRMEVCGNTGTRFELRCNGHRCKEHFGIDPLPELGHEAQPTKPADDFPYTKELKFFTDAMVYKLRKNAHKGKWENLDLATAFRRMREEVDELERAINHENNDVNIILEAADVANFALIVSNIAARRNNV